MQPYLTFFTRCCRRPEQLKRNIESVRAQTSGDWEQLLVVDQTGKHDIDPILWANQQFDRFKDLVRGEYVYLLDDDGFLLDEKFVETVAMPATKGLGPDVILVKMRTYNLDKRWRIHPEPPMWDLDWRNGQRPDTWIGNGFCVVVRRDVWRRHLRHYKNAPGGDWHFITAMIKNGCTFAKLDMTVAESPHRGCGILFEKCGSDWFKEIEHLYSPERLEQDVWRLTGEHS